MFMHPHPLANLFKRSNYDEPIPSDLGALDYLYKVLLEIRESENCDEVLYEVIHDRSLNKKHDCNDVIINSINVNYATCKTMSLGMIILLYPLLVAMIMIGVIMILMNLKIYLNLMMNMISIIKLLFIITYIMINVYYSCKNCINRKLSTCVNT